MKGCFFAGSYRLTADMELERRLIAELRELIKDGVTQFYTGARLGWDMMCAFRINMLRSEYPQLRLTAVLPCPPYEYATHWSFEDSFFLRMLLKSADEVQYISEHLTDDCMERCDRRLSELSQVCICYEDGSTSEREKAVISSARSSGIRMINMSE